MKTSRGSLEEYLLKYFPQILNDGLDTKICENANEKFNYPPVRCMDIFSGRVTMSEVSEFELYILLTSMIESDIIPNFISRYFTDTEIKTYEKTKYKGKKSLKFPMHFKMIQVADDQWIGKTTARQLVDLRNMGIIRYNENIQRTMRRTIKGERVEYRIMENKRATQSIRASMENDTFIPNAITLNIPDDEYSDFRYNEEEMILTVRKAKNFDIIDGFHRLIAMEQASSVDSKFDYPMELRITNYSADKGQRFIFQEDQKTKMSKIDSDSYNVENDASKVVRRLNDDHLFNLCGQISRNKGLISQPEMQAIIKKLYFSKIGKRESMVKAATLPKELRDDFNLLTEADPRFLVEEYGWDTLLVILIAFQYLREIGVDPERKADIIINTLSQTNQIEQSRFKSKTVTMPTIKLIRELIDKNI